MTKENIHHYLISNYNRLAYTHAYVLGYAVKGMVYAARIENGADLLPYITYVDRASSKNGGTYSLKYRPNRKQIAIINSVAAEVIEVCSVNELERLYANSKFNRGNIFEVLAANAFDGEQVEVKNAKFTESGDIIVKGTHYQVKYVAATFTDERTLHSLAA